MNEKDSGESLEQVEPAEELGIVLAKKTEPEQEPAAEVRKEFSQWCAEKSVSDWDAAGARIKSDLAKNSLVSEAEFDLAIAAFCMIEVG
jgi:hypothetical protein